MLDLLAFDLDGTLVDTESLKARSYGYAAHRLRPDIAERAVVAVYGDYVGRSREEIASGLLERFDLEEAARAHDGSVEPWESFVNVRLEKYREMLADDDLVRSHVRPGADLARQSHSLARAAALVTTSGRQNATLVLDALDLHGAFDHVVTADDVAQTKPDPEGYLAALDVCGAARDRSLVVEDSSAGVRAALAAGLPVLAVPDRLTRDAIQALVDDGRLDADAVTAPDDLADALRRRSEAVGPA